MQNLTTKDKIKIFSGFSTLKKFLAIQNSKNSSSKREVSIYLFWVEDTAYPLFAIDSMDLYFSSPIVRKVLKKIREKGNKWGNFKAVFCYIPNIPYYISFQESKGKKVLILKKDKI